MLFVEGVALGETVMIGPQDLNRKDQETIAGKSKYNVVFLNLLHSLYVVEVMDLKCWSEVMMKRSFDRIKEAKVVAEW